MVPFFIPVENPEIFLYHNFLVYFNYNEKTNFSSNVIGSDDTRGQTKIPY